MCCSALSTCKTRKRFGPSHHGPSNAGDRARRRPRRCGASQKMSGNWCVRLTISAYMPMSMRARAERVSRVRGRPVGSRGLGASGQAMAVARTKVVAHVHGGHLHDLAALQLANDLIVALAHRLRRVLVGAVGADDGRHRPCTGDDGRGVMRGGRGDEGGWEKRTSARVAALARAPVPRGAYRPRGCPQAPAARGRRPWPRACRRRGPTGPGIAGC